MFLFVVTTLLFVRVCAMSCRELKFFGLMDCSDIALTSIDSIYPSTKLYSVRDIIFERNNIMRVNGTELSLWFPNLCSVNLRNNPNLDCRGVWELKINVESDCKFFIHLYLYQLIICCRLYSLFFK